MAMIPPDDSNPFRAPEATIGGPVRGEARADAELIRQTYFSHESSVRSLGILSTLGAVLMLLLAIFFGMAAAKLIDFKGQQGNDALSTGSLAWILAGLLVGLGALYFGVGFGLRKLQPWARWVAVVLSALSIVGNGFRSISAVMMAPTLALPAVIGFALSALVPTIILMILLSAKGSMVFSKPYAEVIRETPQMVYKPGCLMKIILAFGILIIVASSIGLIMSVFLRS